MSVASTPTINEGAASETLRENDVLEKMKIGRSVIHMPPEQWTPGRGGAGRLQSSVLVVEEVS